MEIYDYTEASVADYCYILDSVDRKIQNDVNKRLLLDEKINRTVISSCRELFSEILKQLPTIEKQHIDGFDGVTVRKGRIKYRMQIPEDETVDIKVPNRPIYVSYTVYNFKDKNCKKNYDENDANHTYDCGCVCNGGYLNSIMLSFFMISGHMDIGKWADSLQHELSHTFEQTNMEKAYPLSNIYSYIVAPNMGNEDEGARSVATILYCFNASERKGFSNGLYGYLDAKNIIHPEYSNLRPCDFFKMLKKLNNAVDFVKENPNDKGVLGVLDGARQYGVNYGTLVRRGEIAIAKWNKEASKVLRQYRSDCQRKHGFLYTTDKGNGNPTIQ